MNKIAAIIAAVAALPYLGLSQSFPPHAEQPGSTAIHKDSSVFVGWAVTCEVVRGYQTIEDPSLGYASFGDDAIATGPASGTTTSVVSLGDGGTATLTFATTIINGEGPDFAVFENGLSHTFLELGFVEVSSDGETFVRFPAISEVQTDTQIGGFGSVDCRYIHNFAGKYKVGYGTPFDLEDLTDSAGIDINAVTHIRIVDVTGSIDPAYATYDSQGTIVNNLHPTPFETGGFDLDAVGVINAGSLSLNSNSAATISTFPNPAKTVLMVQTIKEESYSILTLPGEIAVEGLLRNGYNEINISNLIPGMYIIKTQSGSVQKFIKE